MQMIVKRQMIPVTAKCDICGMDGLCVESVTHNDDIIIICHSCLMEQLAIISELNPLDYIE